MPESLTKKRKQPSTDPAQSPSKKPKKSRSSHLSRDKQFNTIHASLVISIPPVFAGNPASGVQEMLDSMVMRYVPAFQGVVLSHSNLLFSGKTATVKDDCPFLVATVFFDATVWRPHVGMNLVGKVNLFSPDHVSLLVHRTFNVSIPRNHIPDEQWVFEYGPAENDPEYGAEAPEQDSEDKQGKESIGKWVQKVTGQKLGGEDGFIGFTVIGLTVANEMLSLLGSMQSDPFSPRHVIKVPISLQEKDAGVAISENEELSDQDPFNDDGEDEDDGNAFRELGRRAHIAAAEEALDTLAIGTGGNERKRKDVDGKNKENKQKRKKS
ncbi:hypothetical protein BDQ17DRAFT_1252550 [Cyathus striatus]|nr:hypothetical protein BDQ17DRAFT_1252550 [Cyathus striatus]